MRAQWVIAVLVAGVAVGAYGEASLSLQPVGEMRSRSEGAPTRTLRPRRHLAIGLDYTGAHLRWMFSTHWAGEFRYQRGKADSNYGDVTADVVGIRLYRFFRTRGRMPLYVGGEVAHASAKSENSHFRTEGMAAGGFGGIEYLLAKRVSISMDVGPYVVSLNEKETNMSQTSLDFVINTAIHWYLF